MAEDIRRDKSLIAVDANINLYSSYNHSQYRHKFVPNPVPYTAFVRAINPKAVMVLLLRNPVTRLFSGYNHHFRNVNRKRRQVVSTALGFDRQVTASMIAWNQCILKRKSPRACVYDSSLSVPNNIMMTSFRQCIYYVIVEDILALMPRDQIFIVRAEDYYKNRGPTLSAIYKALKLPKPSEKLAKKLIKTGVSNKKHGGFKMLKSTANKINNFFRPYNAILAKVLESNKFLWKDQRI